MKRFLKFLGIFALLAAVTVSCDDDDDKLTYWISYGDIDMGTIDDRQVVIAHDNE